ncbi:unnamed protein product, partial [Schistosoma curassoni]|uniref:Ras-GEF domain-containing protein n=1 Tax=Schistosoma curassoni TaxID=6186 RepID=A0A183KGI2_9TREM
VLAYRTVDITKTLQLEELIAREELEYAIEEEVARQTIAAWIERCIFRNRQKHGQLKFKMHSTIERQISTSIDDNDDLNKKSDFLINKSVRIKNQSSNISKSSSSTTTTTTTTATASSSISSPPIIITIKDNGGKSMENPMDASHERANKILAPQLKINKLTINTITTTFIHHTINTIPMTKSINLSSIPTLTTIHSNMITTSTIVNNSTIQNNSLHQYSNEHNTILIKNDSDEMTTLTTTPFKTNMIGKHDDDAVAAAANDDDDDGQSLIIEQYDTDYQQPLLLLDSKQEKKLPNPIDSGNNQLHQLQHKSISNQFNIDQINNNNNNNLIHYINDNHQMTTPTFIDTCLMNNENRTKLYQTKINTKLSKSMIDDQKSIQSIEPYQVTIIENVMGLDMEQQQHHHHHHHQQQQQPQQHHQQQHPPLSPNISTSQCIRTKPTVLSTIKSLSTHNKSRQSVIQKLSKLPDVVEDSDEQGEKRLVYSCTNNKDNNDKFDRTISQTMEMYNLKGDSIKRKDMNHCNIDNNLLSSDYTTHIVTGSSSSSSGGSTSNNNSKIQIKTNDNSSIQHDVISPLQNEMINNESKLMDPNYKYHHNIYLSKHINDSCDDVKKWWRSQLYPNLQGQQQQQQQQQHQNKQARIQSNIHHSNTFNSTNTSTLTPPPPPPLPYSTTVMDEEIISILNSPKKKQQRRHKNQPRIISSLASKRRSGVAAVISRRPYHQSRVNNLYDVTIDEYTNDYIANNNNSNNTTIHSNNNNNNRTVTNITNRIDIKGSHLSQKHV